MSSLFANAVLVHAYTRAQALADGMLVDVSEVAREAGFKVPVALTAAVWAELREAEEGSGRVAAGIRPSMGRVPVRELGPPTGGRIPSATGPCSTPRTGRHHTHYLSGELRLGGRATAPIEDLERYRPATLSGQRLLLHYARADDLTPYLGLVAAEGEVFVQYWLKPGDDPVELAVTDRGEPPAVPEELRGYL